ncbi:hypothetical protein N0V90_002906 [Kalmusia sp. IMI 367209]|nr:hypothetical protein N0V90_002906 [Kalmusia sp. IMI 367209]
MHRVIDTANNLVTTKDDLVISVEAIQCILMEALYHNYAGNLHRAWMAARRAIGIAQMMALHRGFSSPTLKILEPESRKTVDLEHLTFRLAEIDAYLSLMLGLPRASLETRQFTSPKALERCHPFERMERIHYIIYERVLQRTDSSINDLSETRAIDKLLQKAAGEMPPQWWLSPTFDDQNTDGTNIMHDMVRIMVQFSHYHLLVRLHLPYLLRSASDHRYDYSKITAVNVSRELLARYLTFRSTNPAHYYCRGSDFLAFISTTVLCIAHINHRGSSCDELIDGAPSDNVFEFLGHSRPSDRGLMERVLEFIESINHSGTDAISSRISRILRDLLAIEANAASGTTYSTNSSKSENEGLECDGKMMNGGKALHIHIPYFGSIRFERGAISRTSGAAPTIPPPTQDASLLSDMDLPQPDQLLDQADLDPTSSTLRCSSRQIHPMASDIEAPPQIYNATTLDMHMSEVVSHPVLAQPTDDFSLAENDDWDLQGVDIALFDSLFHGSGILGALVLAQVVYGEGRAAKGNSINSIALKTNGIIFLGTPFHGSQTSRWSEIVKWIHNINQEFAQKSLEDLELDSEELNDL